MDEQQRFLLKSNLNRIARDLDVDDVFSYLQSTFVLDVDDVELIKLEQTSRRKAEKLISIIMSKDRNYFCQFYNALNDAEYEFLADELVSGIRNDDDEELYESDDHSLPDIETILKNGGVPQLPNVFVSRPLCLDNLENALAQLKSKDGFVILHGMAGCGKTLLASEILRNEQLVHSCFPGGIFWVAIGKVDEMTLLMKMQNLCSWLSPGNHHHPKNLEDAQNRLRTLFTKYPRSLLVLDDIWSETDIRYFDVRVRTLITSRNSAIADKINSTLKIKVPLPGSLTFKQCEQILAQWVDSTVSELPPEANLIIKECDFYPLAISMIGALLKTHKSRWSFYLSQLRQKKTSKVRSKLPYSYPTLYDAFAVSFDAIPTDLKENYKMLCIFNEGVKIPLDVLAIFWDLEMEETEDIMEELIERSHVFKNTVGLPTFSVHNIQLSYLKEFADTEGKIIEYHSIFVGRYMKQCCEKPWTLKNDGYIYWHFISHLLKASKSSLAIDLMTNFLWLQSAAYYTTSSCIVGCYNDILMNFSPIENSERTKDVLHDLRRFIRIHSYLFSNSTPVDLIQLALSKPPSRAVFNLARKYANDKFHGDEEKLYFEWTNQPDLFCSDLQLTSQLHMGIVKCSQFAYDVSSNLVASCGADKLIRVWDRSTGKELLTLEGHSDVVNHCEFSPDDKHLISCSADGRIKIWSVISGEEVQSLESHEEEVTCCMISPNAQFIVSGSMDRTVKIWDFKSGYLKQTLKEHTDVVNGCCFSPDSKLVASCSNDLTIKVWDVMMGEALTSIESDKDFIYCCMFVEEGILATSLNYIHFYSIEDGSMLWFAEAPSDVLSLALSPNQKYLACTHSDMSARLFDLSNKIFVKTYMGHYSWLTSVSFSPDGKSIVTSSQDGFCKIWNVDYCSENLEVLTDIFDSSLVDEKEFVIIATTKNNRVRLIQSHDNICNSEKFSPKITCCLLSEDLKFSAVGFIDGSIRILEIPTLVLKSNLSKHTGEITLMKLNGRQLLSSSVDNSCILWCLVQNTILCVFNGHLDGITCCRFLSNGEKVMSSSYDGQMIVWCAQTGEVNFKFHHDNHAVLSCEVSHNGNYFLTCSADAKARMWSSLDGNLLLTVDDHDDAVRCVAFSSDDSLFATGSDDGVVKVWNTKNGDLLCEFEDHNGWVLDIIFNESNETVLTLSNEVKWFNLKGKPLQTFHVNGNSIRSICCSNDLKRCITIDNIGYLYVIEQCMEDIM